MDTIIAPRPNLQLRSGTPEVRRLPETSPELSFALVREESAERAALESSIARKFERVYGAHLTHFLPDLLRLDVGDELGAVAGIRPAHNHALFLEQYLDVRVEQAIAHAFRTPVDRAQVVEIGNLAANVAGHAYALFAVLATVLSRAGYRWVACTATPQVSAMLTRMKFSSQRIGTADPERLQQNPADWGDYYASRPRVIVGDVRRAAAKAARDPEMSTLVRRFRRPIQQMAARLKRAG